jgi:hypothetical protein
MHLLLSTFQQILLETTRNNKHIRFAPLKRRKNKEVLRIYWTLLSLLLLLVSLCFQYASSCLYRYYTSIGVSSWVKKKKRKHKKRTDKKCKDDLCERTIINYTLVIHYVAFSTPKRVADLMDEIICNYYHAELWRNFYFIKQSFSCFVRLNCWLGKKKGWGKVKKLFFLH